MGFCLPETQNPGRSLSILIQSVTLFFCIHPLSSHFLFIPQSGEPVPLKWLAFDNYSPDECIFLIHSQPSHACSALKRERCVCSSETPRQQLPQGLCPLHSQPGCYARVGSCNRELFTLKNVNWDQVRTGRREDFPDPPQCHRDTSGVFSFFPSFFHSWWPAKDKRRKNSHRDN